MGVFRLKFDKTSSNTYAAEHNGWQIEISKVIGGLPGFSWRSVITSPDGDEDEDFYPDYGTARESVTEQIAEIAGE